MKEAQSRCATLRAGLPVCSMSLRPWPTVVGTGGHLRILDPGEWMTADGQREECRCDTPQFEHILSPLGIPVEVVYGSPEHHVCDTDRRTLNRTLKLVRVELMAEALFVHRSRLWFDKFEDLIVTHKSARDHLLALTASQRDQAQLELAQHHARVAIARDAAWRAMGWRLR